MPDVRVGTVGVTRGRVSPEEAARQDAARIAAQNAAHTRQPAGARTDPSGVYGGGSLARITTPAFEQQQQTTLEHQFGQEGARASEAATLARMQEQSRLDAAALRDRAQLNNQTFTSRLGQLSTAGAAAPRVEGSPIAGNEAAARSAAFARAKDRAGQTALASLTALQNVMNQRGMLGSTEEAGLTQEGLQGGADVLNEFTRDELMADLDRAAEVSDRTYAGDITQRGQDLSARQSLLALMSSAGQLY